MFGVESRPRRQERILTTESPNALILLKLDGGNYFALNQVGGRVWELCDGTRSVAEMVSIFCQEYGVAAEVLEADILELLEELASELLVADGN